MVRDLFADQGATFRYKFLATLDYKTREPMDLTRCTIISQFKTHYLAADISGEFTCTIAEEPEDGLIEISLSGDETAELVARKYVYDVIVYTPEGDSFRVLEGLMVLTPGASLAD